MRNKRGRWNFLLFRMGPEQWGGHWYEMTMFGTVMLGLLITAAIITVICIPILVLNNYTCDRLENTISLPTEYNVWTGCFVEVEDGLWVPRESYGIYLLNNLEGGK